MDRCLLHSTIRANSCSRPVRTRGASPAPTASPRVPLMRQSYSAQVRCLRDRLFRVTVNNGLRVAAEAAKNCRLPEIHPLLELVNRQARGGCRIGVMGLPFGV